MGANQTHLPSTSYDELIQRSNICSHSCLVQQIDKLILNTPITELERNIKNKKGDYSFSAKTDRDHLLRDHLVQDRILFLVQSRKLGKQPHRKENKVYFDSSPFSFYLNQPKSRYFKPKSNPKPILKTETKVVEKKVATTGTMTSRQQFSYSESTSAPTSVSNTQPITQYSYCPSQPTYAAVAGGTHSVVPPDGTKTTSTLQTIPHIVPSSATLTSELGAASLAFQSAPPTSLATSVTTSTTPMTTHGPTSTGTKMKSTSSRISSPTSEMSEDLDQTAIEIGSISSIKP